MCANQNYRNWRRASIERLALMLATKPIWIIAFSIWIPSGRHWTAAACGPTMIMRCSSNYVVILRTTIHGIISYSGWFPLLFINHQFSKWLNMSCGVLLNTADPPTPSFMATRQQIAAMSSSNNPRNSRMACHRRPTQLAASHRMLNANWNVIIPSFCSKIRLRPNWHWFSHHKNCQRRIKYYYIFETNAFH